jgi:hypothetical protein
MRKMHNHFAYLWWPKVFGDKISHGDEKQRQRSTGELDENICNSLIRTWHKLEITQMSINMKTLKQF